MTLCIYDCKTSTVSVFDANNFCHHISQLTQLMSGNIPHPERFDQMIHIGQGEESLLQIISNLREESLQKSVSGICDPHAILQNLSKQDICFDSKDLISRERNAVDLYDQRDSKGQCSSSASKKGFLKTIKLAMNILNKLQAKFPAYQLLNAMRSGTLGTEPFD